MGSAEGIHDIDVAERGVLLCQDLVVLLLALVEAYVLEQHQFTVSDLGSRLEIVLDQPNLPTQLCAKIGSNWRERVLLRVDALFRTSKVRHHHDLGASLQTVLKGRQRGRDARV
jgi:hypothetical protein